MYEKFKSIVKTVVPVVAAVGTGVLVTKVLKEMSPDDLKLIQKVAVTTSIYFVAGAASNKVREIATKDIEETFEQIEGVYSVVKGIAGND
jgi:hypothetical protein